MRSISAVRTSQPSRPEIGATLISDKVRAPHYPMLVPVISHTPEERADFHALPPVQRMQCAGTKNELAGTGRQHHPRPIHPMERRQLRPQRGVLRVGVTRGVGLLRRSQRVRAWPHAVAVGGEVEAGCAQGVGAAVLGSHGHGVIKMIATSAGRTCARGIFY